MGVLVVAAATASGAVPALAAPEAGGTPITPAQYSLIGADSQSPAYPAPPALDGTAAGAFDDDYGSQWTVAYTVQNGVGVAEPMPHWITFDVGGSFTLTGLDYSVKDQSNGPVKDFSVFATNDESIATNPKADWGAAVATGSFVQPTSNTQVQTALFGSPVKARYVKFEADSAVNGSDNASASELRVLATGDTTPAPVTTPPPADDPVSVGSLGTWSNPDDTPASLFTDKDGTFHYEQADALYGATDPRHWTFYTGTTLDDAKPATAIDDAVDPADPADKNSDTTSRCNNSPTGLTSTFAPAGSNYAQRNYCDLTQMWVDPDTGDWYGLVHNEFTPQPFGDGLHYDAIDYAVSTDQGKTWKIKNQVVTTPYSTERGDTATFPQQTYDYGDGDPRLYVDAASGYFYMFYGSRIVDKTGSWKAFYEHVARAPIADKMAAGSWQKWYGGAWSQPGLKGLESNIVPTSSADSTGYTAPADEYDPANAGTAAQQIAAGTMPATSPLFVMDVTYNAYLGLYIGEAQNPDQSGDAPQEYYATDNLATQKWHLLGDTGSYHTASWYRWFLDPANATSTSIVGKTFRSYCSFGCSNGSDSEYANITIGSSSPAAPVDTRKTYTIGSAAGQLLSQVAGTSSTTSAAGVDSSLTAWTFSATGDGAYTIANASTGQLLGVNSTSTTSRAWGTAPTATTSAKATVGQQWFVVPNTSPETGKATGSLRLVNRYSGLVLGLSGGSEPSAQTTPARTWDHTVARSVAGLPTVAEQTLSLTAVTVPAPPALAVTAPANGSHVASRTVTFTGTGAPGQAVTILDSSGRRILQVVPAADGIWTGTHTFGAKDPAVEKLTIGQPGAGASGAARALTITLPAVTATAPVGTPPAGGAPSDSATGVTATASDGSDGSLAFTGSNAALAAAVGGLLLAIGGTFAFVARRRRLEG
ncbi:hypothetical protein GCM10025867_09640 [Frondihabitans sucicola]|uniref:F5/8 type C domain-containing protein n=1 Tax=Frondihabitans sucicola TaxID=1268041 RepID=A0ABM8GK01_9MICO|nr:discoidin domain-containing protein [Frondihabitans sucicola]BDZ48723.1 hypothetical protein GCM10025867_09640 [Frondihabitans sucicola]